MKTKYLKIIVTMITCMLFFMLYGNALAESFCPEGGERFSGSETFCPNHGGKLKQVTPSPTSAEEKSARLKTAKEQCGKPLTVDKPTVNDLHRAIQACTDAINLFPDESSFYLSRAMALFMTAPSVTADGTQFVWKIDYDRRLDDLDKVITLMKQVPEPSFSPQEAEELSLLFNALHYRQKAIHLFLEGKEKQAAIMSEEALKYFTLAMPAEKRVGTDKTKAVFEQVVEAYKLARSEGFDPIVETEIGIKLFKNRSRVKALKHLYAGALKGYAPARNWLYRFYMLGDGEMERFDFFEAILWLRLSANQGYAGAAFNTGQLYETGSNRRDAIEVYYTRDEQKAIQWYRKAADAGLSYGIYKVGTCYRDGIGVEIDASKAFELFQQAEEVDHRSNIQVALGDLYRNGIGVKQSDATAAGWYRKAADKGYKSAKTRLEKLIADGKIPAE